MTNSEYERGCNTAALGLAKLAAVDAKITETEQALVYLLHARREIVNQYDLNKCKHQFKTINPTGEPSVKARCRKCGADK